MSKNRGGGGVVSGRRTMDLRAHNNVGGGGGGGGSAAASRERQQPQLLRQNIEAKIRETLSPLSAKRALDQLRPLLAELDDGLMEPIEEPSPGVRHPLSKTTTTTMTAATTTVAKHMDSSHGRRKRNQNAVVLPSITSILAEHYSKRLVDGGNNNHGAASPAGSLGASRGARSATSDTLSVTRVAVPLRAASSTTEQAMERIRGKLAGHTQPTYNAPAALSLMRLERNTRKPDFSAFWNWKDDASSTGAEETEARRGEMKAQLQREVAEYLGTTTAKPTSPATRQREKVERVQQMKMTYFHGNNAGGARAPRAVVHDGGDSDADGDDEEYSSANYTGPLGRPKGGAVHLDPLSLSRGTQPKATAIVTHGAVHGMHRPMMQHGGGPPPVRGVDAPLTDADMAAVYKYFMTDEDSRPTTGGVGQHVAAMPDHHAAVASAAAAAAAAEHAAARGGPVRAGGGRALPALQVGLGGGPVSPSQMSPVNDGSQSILFSRKSSGMVVGQGQGHGAAHDMSSQHGESPDGLSRLASPVAAVDSLLDWTRSLDPNLL
jgi:hypothetical protein